MNKYEGKSEEEAVKAACADLGIADPKTLNYQVISVKKTLFSKTVTIGIYSINDVIVFADDYIKRCLRALGLEGSTEAKYEDGVIKLNIVTAKNKNVIGRNGDTLRSINELTRSACFNRSVVTIVSFSTATATRKSNIPSSLLSPEDMREMFSALMKPSFLIQ